MWRLLCGIFLLGGTMAANAVIENALNSQKEASAGSATLVSSMEQPDQPATKTFTVETGASPGKLGILNDVPPMGACVIFLDAVMGADGRIGYWQFYSYGPGFICLGIFNKKKTKDGRTLLESAGKNCINITDQFPGFKEIEIPVAQRLSVNPSSVVSIRYASNEVDEKFRVISVESENHARIHPELTLGRVMVIPKTDILPGQFFEESLYMKIDPTTNLPIPYKAFPSFKAVVVGMSHVIELRNGTDCRSGVAMIYMNNVWGTICDRWFHEKGWPFLYCSERDYPDTEQIYFTDTPERQQVPPSTPIHLKNPRCKFSQNVTIFSCATHDNVTCNHTNDVYIRCKSKVELRKGPVASEGVCYVYESNYWGTICEKGPLKLDDHHWSNVCCRERGFSKAVKITYAKDEIITDNQSVAVQEPVSMYSPSCDKGNTFCGIESCRDGPLENRCTHDEDVYVRCG